MSIPYPALSDWHFSSRGYLQLQEDNIAVLPDIDVLVNDVKVLSCEGVGIAVVLVYHTLVLLLFKFIRSEHRSFWGAGGGDVGHMSYAISCLLFSSPMARTVRRECEVS